ncbi:transglycosylase family protein [Saccharomonospora marina XMU15]|uniref:Transglycosylase family protein n=1 Tax=Saccharomonospora marina XMU15 TaxID=882083 RepID=H5XAY0_9PSEU|nr:lytic murein transglycosylase [Saccharomonospora marina]EHR52690.1 transglycosylase family protein [Saccharomonospora marina XMU15]
MSDAARRFSARHKTVAAMVGGSLAMLPVLGASGAASWWLKPSASAQALPLEGGYAPPVPGRISVDGSLPDSPDPQDLRVYQRPSPGPQGIPRSALRAYRKAAEAVGRQYPQCNLDWALLASIGRIESNHARGGYVDNRGDTLEPILGPVLNGVGPVAAVVDTDGGRHDRDSTWDRAVGPMQFIPGTWARYAADGNGDGKRDPNNLYDSTVAAARYLCSGGFDLADDDQLRAAIYRYNNSWSYVDTVIRWARAYREAVLPLPDSDVPLAVPRVLAVEAPAPRGPRRGPTGEAGDVSATAPGSPTSPGGELAAEATPPPAPPQEPSQPTQDTTREPSPQESTTQPCESADSTEPTAEPTTSSTSSSPTTTSTAAPPTPTSGATSTSTEPAPTTTTSTETTSSTTPPPSC